MYNTSGLTQCLAWQVICSDILVFIHVQGWEGHFMAVLGTGNWELGTGNWELGTVAPVWPEERYLTDTVIT
jgi:hypothetical protein